MMVEAYTCHLKSYGDHKNRYIPLHSFYVMKFYAGLTNRVVDSRLLSKVRRFHPITRMWRGYYIANISQIMNETDQVHVPWSHLSEMLFVQGGKCPPYRNPYTNHLLF